MLNVIILSFVALVGGSVYGLFFTSLPFKGAAAMLPAEQAQFGEINGSIAEGIKLKDVHIDNEYFTFKIEEFHQDYDFFENMNSSGKVEFKSLVARNGLLEFKPKMFENKNPNNQVTKKDPAKKQDRPKRDREIKDFKLWMSIVNIKLENLKLIIAANPNNPMMKKREFELKNFVIDKWLMELGKQGEVYNFAFSLARSALETGTFKYELANLKADKNQVNWDTAEFTVFAPISDKLKGDLDLQIAGGIKYDFSQQEPAPGLGGMQALKPDLKITSLQRQIEIQIQPDWQVDILANNFTPSQFFQTENPMTNINFTSHVDNPMLLMMAPVPMENASFQIGEVVYTQTEEPQFKRMPASVVGPPEPIQTAAAPANPFGMAAPKDLHFIGAVGEEQVKLKLSPNWIRNVPSGQFKVKYSDQNLVSYQDFLAHNNWDESAASNFIEKQQPSEQAIIEEKKSIRIKL